VPTWCFISPVVGMRRYRCRVEADVLRISTLGCLESGGDIRFGGFLMCGVAWAHFGFFSRPCLGGRPILSEACGEDGPRVFTCCEAGVDNDF
jgi:hypothetical protein